MNRLAAICLRSTSSRCPQTAAACSGVASLIPPRALTSAPRSMKRECTTIQELIRRALLAAELLEEEAPKT
jgi:hypothetical protein